MSARTLAATGLLLIGLLASSPGLVLLGFLTLVTTWLSTLWSARGIDGVVYDRRLATDRAVWGDRVPLAISIENRRLLPVAWVQADDFATDELRVPDGAVLPSDRPGLAILRNVWSLAPYEHVRRQVHVEAAHRGRIRFESVRLSVADVFGR